MNDILDCANSLYFNVLSLASLVELQLPKLVTQLSIAQSRAKRKVVSRRVQLEKLLSAKKLITLSKWIYTQYSFPIPMSLQCTTSMIILKCHLMIISNVI